MTDILDRIIDVVLENFTWVLFGVFLISGLFGRSGKKKPEQGMPSTQTQTKPVAPGGDNRPLAERMAEYLGGDLHEEPATPAPRPQPKAGKYASDGRRSTTTGNVQQQYPQLFGGSSMFDDNNDKYGGEESQWGFDEAEWGTTFEKNDEQWGSAFGDRKDSEPRVEWPR